jgi:DNA-binding MarR family transcriptional regulator
MTDERTIDDIPIPALLRAARGAYGTAVRASLAASGFDDLPPNGPFVLGGIVNHGENVRDLLRGLGMNRERGRELLVTLVQRGYMQRTADAAGEDEPERIPVEPTQRGRDAAAAVQSAIRDVDTKLAQHCSQDEIRGMRSALFALNLIRDHARGQASN